jgi:carboxypeptidase C (cathepsin A)
VLADLMVTQGMRLDGVVLNSSVLDYNSNCGLFSPGKVSCAGYLPSYGMTGAWFGLLAPQPTDTDAFAQQMRDFTDVQYAPAVTAFLGAGTPPTSTLLDALVSRTGAPRALWSTNLNLDPTSYRSQTLTAQLMGRYDARIAVAATSPLAAGGDPSSSVINAPFTAAQRSHLANELLYTNASSYTMLGGAINTWDFSHDDRALPDTIPDLATALVQQPSLRVLSINGYHDLATPFRQTEFDLARLGTVSSLRIKVYPGGHMTYLDDASRPLIKAELVRFITGAP